jgi:hypothetical protein
MSYVDDLPRLIEEQTILPCQPQMSRLLIRARDGSMPPPESTGPRPSEEDVLAIRRYLGRPCAGP